METTEEPTRTGGGRLVVGALVVAIVAVAAGGWVLVERAGTVGGLLAAWLGGLAVIAALLVTIGGIARGQQPPRLLGPLMALAVFAFALRGAVALVVLLV